MKKTDLIIVMTTFAVILAVIFYLYSTTQNTIQTNETVTQSIKAYFTDLNQKNGFDGNSTGYLINNIVVENISEHPQSKKNKDFVPDSYIEENNSATNDNTIHVTFSTKFYTNNPKKIPEYASVKLMANMSTGLNKPFSLDEIRAITIYELWDVDFKKVDNQWIMEGNLDNYGIRFDPTY